VKKEACEVVETLGGKNVVKLQATKEFKTGAKKAGPTFFWNIQNFEILKFFKNIYIFWQGVSVDIGRDSFSEILHSRLHISLLGFFAT
jgi:hypothetical protein